MGIELGKSCTNSKLDQFYHFWLIELFEICTWIVSIQIPLELFKADLISFLMETISCPVLLHGVIS